MSFRHREFVAGNSSDEDGDHDDVSLGSIEDYISNDGPDVELIIGSCAKGIVKMMSLEEKEACMARRRISPQPEASVQSRKRISPQPATSIEPLLKISKVDSQSASDERGQEDNEFTKLLQARALRFGLYGATVNARSEAAASVSVTPSDVSASKSMRLRPLLEPLIAPSNSVARNDAPSSASMQVATSPEPFVAPSVAVTSIDISASLSTHSVTLPETSIAPSERQKEEEVSSKPKLSVTQTVIGTELPTRLSDDREDQALTTVSTNVTPIPSDSLGASSKRDDSPTVSVVDTEPSEEVLRSPSVESQDSTSARRTVHFQLDVSHAPALSAIDFNTLKSVLSKGSFNSSLTPAMMNQINVLRAQGVVFTDEMLVKFRHELLVQRAASVHASLVKGNNIAQRYNRGESIITIAKSLKAPAIACFRFVLQSKGFSKGTIKGIISGKQTLDDPRDVENLQQAKHTDTTTTETPDVARAAAEFEAQIQAMLDDVGIRYQTQADMVNSKSALTPDFLINHDQLYIDGQLIRWIDAKDFFGGTTGFYLSKLKQQAKKYTKAFGPGAVIFSHGLTRELIVTFRDLGTVACDIRWFTRDGNRAAPPRGVKRSAEAAGLNLEPPVPAKREEVLYVAIATPSLSSSSTVTAPSTAGGVVEDEHASVHKSTQPEESTVTAQSLEPSSLDSTASAGSDGGQPRQSYEEAWMSVKKILIDSQRLFDKTVKPEVVQEVNAIFAKADIEPYTADELFLIWYDLQYPKLKQALSIPLDVLRELVESNLVRKDSSASFILQVAESCDVYPLAVLRLALETRKGKAHSRLVSFNTTKELVAFINAIGTNRNVQATKMIVDRNLTFFPRPEQQFEAKVQRFLQSVKVNVSIVWAPVRHLQVVHSELTIEGSPVNWIITCNTIGGLYPKQMIYLKDKCERLVKKYNKGGAIIFALGFDPTWSFDLPERVVFVDFRLLGIASSSS